MALRTVAEELSRMRLGLRDAVTTIESLRLCNTIDYRHLQLQVDRLTQRVADLEHRPR